MWGSNHLQSISCNIDLVAHADLTPSNRRPHRTIYGSVRGRLGGRGRCLSCPPQPRRFLPRAASRLASGSRLSDPKRTAATVTGSRGVKFINLVVSRGLSAQNPLWVRPCGYPPVFPRFRKTARPESARLFGPGTAERDVAYHLTKSRSRVDFADGQICPKFAFSSFDFTPWQRRLTGD